MHNEPYMRHEDVLKKVKLITVIVAAAFTALGITLIMFPNEMQTIMGFVIGIGAIAVGAYRIYIFFRRQNEVSIIATDLFLGVLCVIAGIAFIARHSDVPRYVVFVYGIFLIGGCIIKLQNAIDLFHVGMYRWWIVLVLAAVSAVMAGILLIRPAAVEGTFSILSGIFLLYDGISGFVTVFLSEMTFRRIRKGIPVGKPAPRPAPEQPSGPVPPAPAPEQARSITDDDPFAPGVMQAESGAPPSPAPQSGPAQQAMRFDPETGERLDHGQ